MLIRLDGLGDFVLWLSSAESFRQLYPAETWKITLIGNRSWTALAPAELFDEIWAVDYRSFILNPGYRLALLKRIRQSGFDLALTTVWSRDFLATDALVRNSGATERIGYCGDLTRSSRFQLILSDRWYTQLVEGARSVHHEYERHRALLRALGAERLPECLAPLPRRAEIEALVPACGYAVFAPGAGKPYRRWPPENFASLADRLWQDRRWPVVVVGVAEESHLAERMVGLTGAPLVNLCGRTSPAELIEIVRGARIVIGNETSSSQIAAALSVPAVTILGGGHFGRFLPFPDSLRAALPPTGYVSKPMPCYNCDWACPFLRDHKTPVPCIDGITVDQAWAVCCEVLAASAPPSQQA